MRNASREISYGSMSVKVRGVVVGNLWAVHDKRTKEWYEVLNGCLNTSES